MARMNFTLFVKLKGGKEKALMALFGKCMKELKGNCNPQVLREMLLKSIENA